MPTIISDLVNNSLSPIPPPPQAVKHPKSAYRYLQLLVGQKFDSPIVKKYLEWFPFYDIKKDEERGKTLSWFSLEIIMNDIVICI